MSFERLNQGDLLAPFAERLSRRPETLATLLLAVEGLWAQRTSHDARELAHQGIEQIITLMPRFDLGDWSAQDTTGKRASALRHNRHVRALGRLAHETGDQRLLGWRDRFAAYRDTPGHKLKLPWRADQPAGDNYHDEIARTYLAERVHKPIWDAEHRAVALFLDMFPHGQSVLDLPFGTGRFVPLYLAREMTVTGVDISQSMLNEARRALGVRSEAVTMLQGDALSLPFANEDFDGVVSVRFLESIIPFADVAPVLREMHRVTRRWAIVRLNTRALPSPTPHVTPAGGAPLKFQFDIDQIGALCHDCGWQMHESIIVGRNDKLPGIAEQRICLLHKD